MAVALITSSMREDLHVAASFSGILVLYLMNKGSIEYC